MKLLHLILTLWLTLPVFGASAVNGVAGATSVNGITAGGVNGVTLSSPFNAANYGTVALWAGERYGSGADGSAVSSQTDYSGNSRTLTQAVGAAQPTRKTTGVTGVTLPVAQFDGGDVLNTSSFTQAQPLTIALVCRSTDGANINNPCGTVAGFSCGISARADATWLAYAGAGISFGTSTSWSVIVAVFDGASSFVYVNGSKTTGNPGTGGFSAVGFQEGAWATSQNFLGYIGEVVMWNGALSDANAAAACASLRTDWGL